MPPVQFNEQENALQHSPEQEARGGVTNLIFKLGLAKNIAQANIVMIVVSVIAVGLAVYLMLPSRAAAPVQPEAMPPAVLP